MFICNEIFLNIAGHCDEKTVLMLKITCKHLFFVIEMCPNFFRYFGNKMIRFCIKNKKLKRIPNMIKTMKRENVVINYNKLHAEACSHTDPNYMELFCKWAYDYDLVFERISFRAYKEKMFPIISSAIIDKLILFDRTDIMSLYENFKDMELNEGCKFAFAVYFLDIEEVKRFLIFKNHSYYNLVFHEYHNTDAIYKLFSLLKFKVFFRILKQSPMKVINIYVNTHKCLDLVVNYHFSDDTNIEALKMISSRITTDEKRLFSNCLKFLRRFPGEDWSFLRKRYEVTGFENYLRKLDEVHSMNIELLKRDEDGIKNYISIWTINEGYQGFFSLLLLKREFLWVLKIVMSNNPVTFIPDIVKHNKRKALQLAFDAIIKNNKKVVITINQKNPSIKMFNLLQRFYEENIGLVQLRYPIGFDIKRYKNTPDVMY